MTMNDRPKQEAQESEKMDTTSHPSPELQSMHNSASSDTANMNSPVGGNSPNGSQQPRTATASAVKPSTLKWVWGKLGFNPMVIMFMVKGSLPPTIAISIYQRYSVAVNYLNLGYVMIVISILTVPMLPRGKFLLNLLVSLVSAGCYFPHLPDLRSSLPMTYE